MGLRQVIYFISAADKQTIPDQTDGEIGAQTGDADKPNPRGEEDADNAS